MESPPFGAKNCNYVIIKPMESYEKLVRDNIPNILDQKGVIYEKRVASPEEFKRELIRKLQEEVGEFAENGDVTELADVIEVVEALKKLPGYEYVEKIRTKKLVECGGFDQKLILKGEK